MIARAFDNFASSRSLYSRLRDDFDLPSISLLTKLTSKVGNLEVNGFLESYSEHCTDPRQRNVIIIINGIYSSSSSVVSAFGLYARGPGIDSHHGRRFVLSII